MSIQKLLWTSNRVFILKNGWQLSRYETICDVDWLLVRCGAFSTVPVLHFAGKGVGLSDKRTGRYSRPFITRVSNWTRYTVEATQNLACQFLEADFKGPIRDVRPGTGQTPSSDVLFWGPIYTSL